jgi:Prolyl oligopeptidase, N-terminal beta-propeller domain
MVETPPIARREEDRVVYAGSAPDGWDPKFPRQANDSTEPLMTPPVAIPDPYGWMRDDKRENQEVLDHLNAENAYSKSVIKHLEVSEAEPSATTKEFLVDGLSNLTVPFWLFFSGIAR